MIKYEINYLHKVAQMGKECCEHILEYANNEMLKETIKNQSTRYDEQMHDLEDVYLTVENINRLKSRYYNAMIKFSLYFKNDNHELIRCLIKGNLMGLKTVTEFIQCPYNSDKSKQYASNLLQSININLEEIMSKFIYQ